MFNGKMKAITFSFDDGVTQDKRLIEILNKYNLKATFNINSGRLGQNGSLERNGKHINHTKILRSELKTLYSGHEVAAHTLNHPLLTGLSEDEIIREVEDDRRALCELSGQDVVGMAYPCGGVNCDERVAAIIKEKTGIKYARTIASNKSFSLQNNLYLFNPTVSCIDADERNALAEKFIALETASPALFYIWGHSYEFDIDDTWEQLERFCEKISGKADIFYGTNREVLGL